MGLADQLKRAQESVVSRASAGLASGKAGNGSGSGEYEYVAVNNAGVRHKGKMAGSSKRAVAEALQADGWMPLEIREGGNVGMNVDLGSLFNGGKKPKVRLTVSETSQLFRQISELLRAGVPMARVLTALAEESSDKVKGICLSLADRLNSGVPLSEALADYPDAFDVVTCAYVSAGESSGTLGETMGRLAKILEKRNQLRLKIQGVTAYPKMVGGAIALITGAILIFLVPRFQTIYADFGSSLPLPTQALVALSDNIIPIKPQLSFPMPFFVADFSIIGLLGRVLFLVAFGIGTDALRARSGKQPKLILTILKWGFAAVVTIFATGYTFAIPGLIAWTIIIGGYVSLRMFLTAKSSNLKTAKFIDTFRFRMPVFGGINSRNALFQWSSTLGGAMASGVPLTQAINLAGRTSGSRWHELVSADLEAQVRAGKPFSEALADHSDLYPASVRTMVSTGETTGDLATMFDSIASTIDTEIEALVAGLGAKVEVALLLVMSVVVGGLLVALYLPIIQLAATVGGQTGG